MAIPRVTVAIAFCYLLFPTLSAEGYSPNTKFTKTPPSTVYGVLGRHVYFRWKFSFADSKDRSDFESVIWGETNTRNRIVDKYITVFPDGRWEVNPTLKPKLKARLAVSVVNITQSECNVEFVLKNVVKEDTQPTYGCEVKIFLDEKKDGPIQLAMAASPQITGRSNSIIDTDEGNNVTLLCDATGDPVPTVEWIKNGKPLQSSNRKILIRNIQRSDGGNYVCTAKNVAGSDSYSVYVRVVRCKYFSLT